MLNTKPRRFHLEIPESDRRRQHLQQVEERLRREEAVLSAGGDQPVAHDFSHLRGSFRYSKKEARGRLPHGLASRFLLLLLLVALLSAVWIWLLN